MHEKPPLGVEYEDIGHSVPQVPGTHNMSRHLVNDPIVTVDNRNYFIGWVHAIQTRQAEYVH